MIARAATSRARSSARSRAPALPALTTGPAIWAIRVGLPVGRRPECPQVPGLHAVLAEGPRALGDHHRVLVEQSARAGGDDARLAQRAQQVLAHPGAVQQVLAAQPHHRRGDAGSGVGLAGARHQTWHRIRGSGARQFPVGLRVELRLDHLQRQVLVALGGQDEAQPRAVVGGEPAIPRSAALRRDETLCLQKPDLEIVTSGKSGRSRSRTAPIDIPASAGVSGRSLSFPGRPRRRPGLGPVRNTNRNLPICTSSPLVRVAESTGSRLT